MSLRRRLAIAALATSAASLSAVLFLVGPGLRGRATEGIRERLTAEARLLTRLVEVPLARGEGPDAIDPLVDATARDVAARVTVIAVDGRVLGESTLSGAALLRMENHVARPEVREAVLRTGERRAALLEIRHLRRSFAIAGVTYPGDQGAPHGAVLTFHDVTERHRVERMRRDFVANASHELRTPLTSIRGFVEALEDGALAEPATAARFLAKIRSHTERMAGLVQDLPELSRIEAGERPPQLQPTRPAEIAREVLDAFREAAARKRIELHESGGDAPVVPSDPDHVRRILENFADNPIKYTPEGGRVEVRTAAAEAGGAAPASGSRSPSTWPRTWERASASGASSDAAARSRCGCQAR